MPLDAGSTEHENE